MEVEARAGVVVREGNGEPKLRPSKRSVAVVPAWTHHRRFDRSWNQSWEDLYAYAEAVGGHRDSVPFRHC